MRVDNKLTQSQNSISSVDSERYLEVDSGVNREKDSEVDGGVHDEEDNEIRSEEESRISREENIGNGKDFIKLINERRSVRHFTNQKVSKESLKCLVKAGMSAPSVFNLQSWMFIIVDDSELLNELGTKVPGFEVLSKSQSAILVCGDMDKTLDGDVLNVYWLEDCSAASQNILLAAKALGLGALWMTIYPEETKLKLVREVLNIPNNLIPLNIIPIGYSQGVEQVKNKFKLENIHWNKWIIKNV